MKILFFLSVFLQIASIISAQDWELIYSQNTNIQGDLVKGMVLPDSNLFYAVGNDIFIYNDSGYFQNRVNSTALPVQEDKAVAYFDMQFVSESEVYMIYYNNIYISHDAGLTWTTQLSLSPINSSYNASSYLTALYFPNENTGYAVGTFKKIYKTQDGGITWDEISGSASTTPYVRYSGVYFFDENVGFVSGYEVADIGMNFAFEKFIIKTTDGGETWERYEIQSNNDFKRLSLDFKTEQTGFVFASIAKNIEGVFVTNDSAKTWNDVTPENIEGISCVSWIDTSTGILYGERDNTQVLLKTVNQGKAWYEVPLPVTHILSENTINDITFVNNTNGYTVGEGGLIMYTNDAGESWQVLNNRIINLWQIDFSSENTAFGNTGYELFKTTDGGQTWNYLEEASGDLYNYVIDIDFKNDNEGYALGFDTGYLKTNNGLQTFETGTLPVSFFLYYKYLKVTDNAIYIAGTTTTPQTNKLLISTDDGSTWDENAIGFDDGYVASLQVFNDTLIASTAYDIISSTDNGATWNTILHSDTAIQYSIFPTSNVGYIATTDNLTEGKYKKTVNGGQTWNTINVLPNGNDTLNLKGVLPINTDLVYAYGYKYNNYQKNAVIWESKNGGQTWQTEQLPLFIAGEINQMFRHGDYIYAVASQGEIIRLQIENPVTTNNLSPENNFKIYPNPAKDEVFISGSEKILEINVYSLNGNLLKVMKLNQKECSINISHLSNGFYIINCKTESGIKKRLFYKE